MKKIFPLFLALAILVTLAGCGNSATPSVTPSQTVSGDPDTSPGVDPSASPTGGTPSSTDPLPSPSIDVSLDMEPDQPWGDPTFEKAIRAALNQPEGNILEEQTASLTKLSIVKQGDRVQVTLDDNEPVLFDADEPITALEDIIRFPNLVSIELGYAKLDMIGQLAFLMSLESITVTDAGVKDLSLLEMCAKVKTLDLSNNDITDISSLATMPSLEKLIVTGNPLNDASQVDLFENAEVVFDG